MSDLISRQVAIDAIQGIERLATLPDNDAVIRMSAVEYVLYNLPSAQPEHSEGLYVDGYNDGYRDGMKDAQSEPIKIKIEDFNKEDWERLKKEWGNTPITVPSAQPEMHGKRTETHACDLIGRQAAIYEGDGT